MRARSAAVDNGWDERVTLPIEHFAKTPSMCRHHRDCRSTCDAREIAARPAFAGSEVARWDTACDDATCDMLRADGLIGR